MPLPKAQIAGQTTPNMHPTATRAHSSDALPRPSDRGQANIETMAIFAAVLVMIMAVLMVLPSSAQSGEVLRQEQMAKQTVQMAASAADEVYLAGEGASKTVWVEIPGIWDANRSFIGNKTAGMSWSDRKLISLYVRTTGDIFGVSRAPLCGSWPATSGKFLVNVTYNSTNPAHVMINSNKC